MIEKIGRTLEELYDTYIKDFSKFLQLTSGVIFEEENGGQLKMIFIEDPDDLSKYYEYTITQLDEDNNNLHITVKE